VVSLQYFLFAVLMYYEPPGNSGPKTETNLMTRLPLTLAAILVAGQAMGKTITTNI